MEQWRILGRQWLRALTAQRRRMNRSRNTKLASQERREYWRQKGRAALNKLFGNDN